MFVRGHFRAVHRVAACLLLAAGSGCIKPFWVHDPQGPLLDQYSPQEAKAFLRPGDYCEVEMNVPLTASNESFDCYKGTVKEFNQDELVLTDATEGTCIEYATSPSRPPTTVKKHDLVHIPVMGVDSIWALPRSKGDAPPAPAAMSSARRAAIALPSTGARATPPINSGAARDDTGDGV